MFCWCKSIFIMFDCTFPYWFCVWIVLNGIYIFECLKSFRCFKFILFTVGQKLCQLLVKCSQ